jgi:hypothetical protein
MKRIAFISTIALLAACDNPTVQEDSEIGRIGGYVTDLDGNPIKGVSIEAQGLTAESGEDGLYYIDGVSPAETILVTFKKRGYAKGYNSTSIISWETVGVDGTLLEIDGTGTLIGSAGGIIEVDGVTVDFDASSVISADGSPYSGQITVEITHLDPHTEMAAAPGDLTALSFSLAGNGNAKDALTDAQLVSYGMLNVSLFGEDGEELNIDEDSPVAISMPISNGALPDVYWMADGDTQNTWSFIPEQGRWVEEGMGSVVADEEGNLSFDFEATHFSWWNCDMGMVPTCASGRVVDMLGFPVRGASVTCQGGSSVSTSTTDENGYYVCSVLTGDTVSFIGETFVANSWAWDKNVPVKYMDGEGSSAATCEPIQTIVIEVCRETGVVSVQNVEAVTESAAAGNTIADSDTVAAFFWEPPGFPQYCDNPWKSLALDSCATFSTNDVGTHFPNVSNHGLPSNGRSVGTYLEVSTPRKDYRMMREHLGATPVYVWDNEDVSSGGDFTDNRPDIRSNDDLHIYAPGDASHYAGTWDEPYFARVPTQALMGDNSFMENSGSSQTITYSGTSGDDLLVMGVSMSDGDSESMICRMKNDGSVRIPGNAMNGMDRGYAGLGIYNANTGWAMGPDGLPVRLQIFSGSTTLVDLQ